MKQTEFLQLLIQLRSRGYEFGIGDVIDAVTLARLRVANGDGEIAGMDQLTPLLSAVICKSADQQRTFPGDWADICLGMKGTEAIPLPKAQVEKRKQTEARHRAQTRIRTRQRWIIAVSFAVAFATAAGLIWLQPEPTTPTSEPVDVTVSQVGFPQARDEATGARATPLPTLGDPPGTATPETSTLTEPEPPPDATLTQRLAAEVQPNWGTIAQIVPVIVFVMAIIWLLGRAAVSLVRKRANTAKWGRRRVRLEGLRLEGVIEPLMQSAWHRKAIYELRGYRQRETDAIDVDSTVTRAIELNGFVEPVFGSVPEIIEYVALFDRRAPRDHFTRYAESLVDALRRADVHVASGYFAGGLERIWVPEVASGPITLAELLTHRPHHRIILFAEGDSLLRRTDLEFYPWVRPLSEHEEVGVLTSAPPQDWSVSEWRLRSMGNLVYSADRLGLKNLSSSLTAGQLLRPLVLYHVAGIPRSLIDSSATWTQSEMPSRRAINRLTDELRVYLGRDGFKWLCATAVYPVLNWELTIFLGSRIAGPWSREALLVERRLLDICRLPWFRTGVMPAWLRWHLISQLSSAERAEVRSQLACLIDAAQRTEDPDAPRIDIAEVPETAPLIGTEEIDEFLAAGVQGILSDFHDYIFASTLRGRRPRKFEATLPPVARSAYTRTLDNMTTVAPVALAAGFFAAWIAFVPSIKEFVDATVHERRDEVLKYTNALHRVWLLSDGELGEPQDYSGRDLSGVDWAGQGPFSQLILDRADLSGSNLMGLNFSNASFREAILTDARLARARLSGADFLRARLSATDLTDADASNASFAEADLSNSSLSGGGFTSAIFQSARLSTADLANADLQLADFTRANLSGADLTDANASGANLATVVNLTEQQINSLCGDSETLVPSPFSVPVCEPSVAEVDPLGSAETTTEAEGGTIPLPELDLAARDAAARSSTQRDILGRGGLNCGITTGLLGFAAPDANGDWSGFDVDFCRAMAAAIHGDPLAVDFVPTTTKTRFIALASGEVDLLARNTAWTFSRDVDLRFNYVGINYYDGQGFMVPKDLGVSSARELDGAAVCIQTGTSSELNLADFFRENNISYEPVPIETDAEAQQSYISGECDAYTTDTAGLAAARATFENPGDHVILPEIISKEPLGPVVRHGDPEFEMIARAVLNTLIIAEELGVTQGNVRRLSTGSTSLQVNALLSMGQTLGLPDDFAVRVIDAVGNYGEIFARNLGEATPIGLSRGLNANWRDGGLLYGFLPISNETDTGGLAVLDGVPGARFGLDEVRIAGELRCGILPGRPGFADAVLEEWTGTEIELCQAIAAAIFGKPAVRFIETTANSALDALSASEFDLIPGGIAWNAILDASDLSLAAATFFDGTSILVPKAMGVSSAEELDGAAMCLPTGGVIEQDVNDFFRANNMAFELVPIGDPVDGFQSYLAGECDGLAANYSALLAALSTLEASPISDHVILPKVMSLLPTGPVVATLEENFADLVRWATFALISAGELGITQSNVAEFASSTTTNLNSEANRLLGIEGDFGEMLGLSGDWAINAILANGNYREIQSGNYSRIFGDVIQTTDLNDLWVEGGLLYSPPFR